MDKTTMDKYLSELMSTIPDKNSKISDKLIIRMSSRAKPKQAVLTHI